MKTGLTCKHIIDHLTNSQKLKLIFWMKMEKFGFISFDALILKFMKYGVLDINKLFEDNA